MFDGEINDFSRVTISNNTFTSCGQDCIDFELDIKNDSVVTITNNNMTNCGQDGIDIDGRIENRSRVTIANNIIRNADSEGIIFDDDVEDDSVVRVINNTITNNDNEGIEFDGGDIQIEHRSRVTISGNTLTGNGEEGLDLEGDIEDNSVVTIVNNIITSNCEEGIGLHSVIEDSAQVIIDGNTISNNGGCPIPVASMAPAGSLLPAAPGDADDEDSDEVDEPVEDDDADEPDEDGDAVIDEDDQEYDGRSALIVGQSVNGITIHDGIEIRVGTIENSTVVISNNTISSNSRHGVYVGGMTAPSQITVSPCNFIFDNTAFGLFNSTFHLINAENNWWGSTRGPNLGDGDGVSGPADYKPWLAARQCIIGATAPSGMDQSTGESESTTLRGPNLNVTYMKVSTGQAKINQPVTISANVVNRGGMVGSTRVALKINGKVEQTKLVTVGPGGSRPVKFTIAKDQPGTYTVILGNQRASFLVTEDTASTSVDGGTIVMILLGFLVLAFFIVVAFSYRRKPSY